jgi:hypothetical protein
MHVGDFQHTVMPPQTAFATVVVFVAWKWVRRHCEGHNMAPSLLLVTEGEGES